MNDKKYEILIDEEIVATRMDIKTATVLIRALFEEYYNQYPMTISVREIERCEVCENVGR